MCKKEKNGGFLNKFINKAFAVGIALIVFAFISFAITIISKVSSGHGLDYYISGKGYELNYLGVLILLAVLPVSALVVWIIAWYQARDERDFEAKYTKEGNEETHNN